MTQPASTGGRSAVVLVVVAIALLGAASMAWIYGAGLSAGGPIRSDGLGYYLYLPALALDRDPGLERTAARSFGGDIGRMQGVRRVPPRGRLLDKYPIGEAMMLTPFFALGHASAIAVGARRDGFSRPYQVAAAAGGLVYAMLGLLLTGMMLLRWFAPGTVVLTLVGITFGTNLFHYATYDATFSHVFSFFLVAVVLQLTLLTNERPTAGLAASLGLAAGLLVAVRPTNVVILVFPLLLGVSSRADLLGRLRAARRHLGPIAIGAAAFVVPLVPQLLYWKAMTGGFVVYSYGDEHLDLLRPYLLHVLFSFRKGLFFWTPLLLVAVAGFALLRRYAAELLVPSVAFLIGSAWVISSWETWWYGGSFGQRPFVEVIPVFSLGLASVIETSRGRIGRPLVLTLCFILTILATKAMLGYWRGVIPIDGVDLTTYLRSLRHF